MSPRTAGTADTATASGRETVEAFCFSGLVARGPKGGSLGAAPVAGRAVRVRISGPRGARFGSLVEPLLAILGASPDPASTMTCRGRRIQADAVLGLPPLVDGVVLELTNSMVAGRPPTPAPSTGLMLECVGGPLAGEGIPLGSAPVVVGREPGADLRLEDGRLSRRHARLRVEPRPDASDAVYLQDLGSSNGTVVVDGEDRHQVGTEEVLLPPGAVIHLGSSVLVARRHDSEPIRHSADGSGQVFVSRAACLLGPRPGSVVHYPEAERAADRARFPWAQILLPLAVAVPMALLWHQPVLLLVAFASPLFFLGQHLFERRSRRRDAARQTAARETATAAADARLAEALRCERSWLEARHPDPAWIRRIAGASRGVLGSAPSRELWQRSAADDRGLLVRLGRGRSPSQIQTHPAQRSVTGAVALPVDEAGRWLDDAPIVLDLGEARATGLAGPADGVRALARSVVEQLATLYSPAELRFDVREPAEQPDSCGPPDSWSASGSDPWGWVSWLPHADNGDDTCSSAQQGAGPPIRRVVVVDALDAPAEWTGRITAELAQTTAATTGQTSGQATARTPARSTAGTITAAGAGPAPILLYLGRTPAALPRECTATVLLDDDGGPARMARAEAPSVGGWTPDLVGLDGSRALAVSLAPYRDASFAEGHLPTRVHLVDLLRRDGGVDPLDADSIAQGWDLGHEACDTPLGADATGPFRVDLDRDGPHLLVAGTTGAGKSQLLLSFIVGLAARHSPDAVTFVLVDYKGGAAFSPVSQLPHVTGLVTDLDPYLTRRLLASLGAEIKRRERLLAHSGAADFREYARRRAGNQEPMPRLVVVLDEFRVLVEELPDFIPGLVRLAAVGRSLGLHLVLATQRPAGVISPDIRANVNLRVALRVRDVADSLDVVECPDAAQLPPSTPGRAVIGLPAQKARHVQIAGLIGGPDQGRPRTVAVERVGHGRTAEVEHDPSSLPGIVEAVSSAWAHTGGRPPRRPWLPPLPEALSRGDLDRGASSAKVPQSALRLGLRDLPEAQSQPVWAWDPSSAGHLAVIGGPGSGRSTTLRTIARAAGDAGRAVHVLDASGGLTELAALAHVGNVVDVRDTERCVRLFEALRCEVEAGPHSSLLLVDGWEALVAAWSEPENLALADLLTTLVRDHCGSGLRAAFSGGRALLTGSIATAFTQRLVLPMADPADAALAGIPAAVASSARARPGGGLLVHGRDITPVQIALPTPWPGRRASDGAVAPPAPWRVPELPARIGLEEARGLHPEPTNALLIGGSPPPASRPDGRLRPAWLPVSRSGGCLIVGRPGSGRSTALGVIAEQAVRAGRPVVPIGPDTAATDLGVELRAAPDAVVLVDDAEAIGEGPVEDLLLQHLQDGEPRQLRVVATSTGSDVLGRYRGLLAELRSGRCGLVIGGVQPGDGEVFGIRLTAARATLPGRGLVIDRGRASTVQVAYSSPGKREHGGHDDGEPAQRQHVGTGRRGGTRRGVVALLPGAQLADPAGRTR